MKFVLFSTLSCLLKFDKKSDRIQLKSSNEQNNDKIQDELRYNIIALVIEMTRKKHHINAICACYYNIFKQNIIEAFIFINESLLFQ